MFQTNFWKGISQRFDDDVAKLRQRASDCSFGAIADLPIKDTLICGVSDLRLSERLLRQQHLTLDKAILAGQAAEKTCKQTKASPSCNTDIDKVDVINRKQFRKKDTTESLYSGKDNNDTKFDHYIHSYKFCAGSHDRGK